MGYRRRRKTTGKKFSRRILSLLVMAFLSLAGYLAWAPEGDFHPARVTEVVDGDTLDVVLPGGREERVRFIGVNTPESRGKVEPYGKEASAYTEKRLRGRTVYLEMDAGERDKYGRLLAYVWLERPRDASEDEVRAKMFNAELLLEGYAQVMTVPPNVKYSSLFVEFQREARDKGKGLWGLQD
ncbi:thermonuclease family protein [Thermanaeromonas sp. C210]|uniref:thermonuclease family protein n=1 Tax=Thermanaeromonas sp. C210 TaxID=2731925 RepID=UPI00155BEE5E|nr:thermonuclease family protein [Thermanaeromonas sp. C210]GFN21876.1 thermonuclease [Thermanaeromonas sp. C210]